MKKWVLAAAAALGIAGAADATVITLQGVSANGANDFTFNYQGTLGPDEGLRSGDRLVIFDFAGYIEGSVFAGLPQVVASTETVSSSVFLTPGQTDDPNLVNLVFTYTGPDFRVEDGPFAPVSFSDLGARSTFGQTAFDAFFALTTKNNPPPEAATATVQIGVVQVPAVPEPATWAMMISGFGLAGMAARRRKLAVRALA